MTPDARRGDLWRRNQETDQLTELIGHNWPVRKIATTLCNWTGYDLTKLLDYAVTNVGGTDALNGENWLEDHAEDALIAAWTAGSPQAAGNRQAALAAFWPALATALDNFEAGFDAQA